jgi:hypothetical protein
VLHPDLVLRFSIVLVDGGFLAKSTTMRANSRASRSAGAKRGHSSSLALKFPGKLSIVWLEKPVDYPFFQFS